MKIHIAQNGCVFFCRHKNNNANDHQSHTIHQKQFNRFNIFANPASAWLSYASHFSRLHLCVVPFCTYIIPALVHSICDGSRVGAHIFKKAKKASNFIKIGLKKLMRKSIKKKMFIWKCDIIVLVYIPWIAAKARAKL